MRVTVNLRHLDAHNVRLEGDLEVSDLDIDTLDEMVQLQDPLHYEVEVQKLETSLLVSGRLSLALECRCVRCLNPFSYALDIPDWTVHLPLEGEDAVLIDNDLVDLTPYLREDILLEFPQHPLCNPDCCGVSASGSSKSSRPQTVGDSKAGSPVWSELDKLKLKH